VKKEIKPPHWGGKLFFVQDSQRGSADGPVESVLDIGYVKKLELKFGPFRRRLVADTPFGVP
jgi:hypothetical protein